MTVARAVAAASSGRARSGSPSGRAEPGGVVGDRPSARAARVHRVVHRHRSGAVASTTAGARRVEARGHRAPSAGWRAAASRASRTSSAVPPSDGAKTTSTPSTPPSAASSATARSKACAVGPQAEVDRVGIADGVVHERGQPGRGSRRPARPARGRRSSGRVGGDGERATGVADHRDPTAGRERLAQRGAGPCRAGRGAWARGSRRSGAAARRRWGRRVRRATGAGQPTRLHRDHGLGPGQPPGQAAEVAGVAEATRCTCTRRRCARRPPSTGAGRCPRRRRGCRGRRTTRCRRPRPGPGR